MDMKAKILCVYEEGSIVNTPLIGAKGSSMLLDVDGQLTLFDTGMRESYLLRNMRHLGIDINSIDRIVLSNGTRPHTGGLNGLLEEREHSVKVYAHKDIWQTHATAVKGINLKKFTPGITEENQDKADMFQISGKTELSENLTAFTLPPAEPDERYKRALNGFWVDDTFADETALILTTKKGPVLITGCCRTSIFNALKAVKEITGKDAIAVIGNISVESRKRKDPELDALSSALVNDVKTPLLYLGYCATQNAKTGMRTKLGLEGLKDWFVGMELQFDVERGTSL